MHLLLTTWQVATHETLLWLPVVKDTDDFSCLECQFVVLCGLKVIQRFDLKGTSIHTAY